MSEFVAKWTKFASEGRMMKSCIAIVGMACRYPDASSPGELWNNVLAGRRAFRGYLDTMKRLRSWNKVNEVFYGFRDAVKEQQFATL